MDPLLSTSGRTGPKRKFKWVRDGFSVYRLLGMQSGGGCRREVTVCLPSSGGIFEVHIGYNCSRFPNPGPLYLVPGKTNILSVSGYPGTRGVWVWEA